jgi:hypothetical protein
MERIAGIAELVETIDFTNSPKCLEKLDYYLQDILIVLRELGHSASGELIDLKGCSWALHERYHLDTEEALRWTFHHTKHRIIRNCQNILERAKVKAA